jgi:SAM-dependent methyltransferase
MKSLIGLIQSKFPVLYQWLQPLRIQKYYLSLRMKSPSAVFREIFHGNGWGGEESVSGHGSSMASTQAIREALPRLLKELECRVLLDVPCGDFHWMGTLGLDVDYIGCDIVPDLVEENQKIHGNARRRFRVLDLITDEIPTADVVLCRDCLVHLSNKNVEKVLKNIKRSGARYLLATTFPESGKNIDIPTGAWRAIDLTRAPFNLPQPIRLIHEHHTSPEGYEDKSLGLWRL